MLRFDRLTVKAQEATQAAQEMAARAGQQQVEPLHILWALIAQGDGVVPPLLEKLGASPAALASEAEKQAQRLKDEYVSTEHILLAISATERDPAAQLLARQGASHDAILQAMASIRG